MHYARSFSAQAMARVVYVVAGTAVFVLLARVLGPEQLGSYVYAINLITVGTAVADLGSTGILARDLVASDAGRHVYLANFIALRFLLAGAVGLLGVPAVLLLAPDALRGVLLLCCALMPLLAARFCDPVFQVGGRPFLSLWHTGGYSVVMLGSAALIAWLVRNPVPWLVLAYVVASALYGGVGLLLARWLMPPDFRGVTRRAVREVAIAIGPFGVSGLFGMLAVRLDVFLVASLGSVAMVGQYNAAFRFIDLGIAVMITVLMPLVTVFAHLAKEDRAALVRAFQAMLRFIATWCTAMAVLAPSVTPLVVRVLYGPAFTDTAPLLCFALLMTVGSIQFTWWNTLLALLLNLALNALMIPSLGILGSGIAAILSELSQTVVVVWFLARAMGNVFDLRWWPRLIGAAAAAAVAVHLPLGLDPLWLFAPGALVFIGVMHWGGGLPGNPLAAVRLAEGAAAPIGS
jgi:O-antigen/teichoic acid export membrane protein